MTKQRKSIFIALCAALLLSSCGTLRDTPIRSEAERMGRDEARLHERRLGMPLTGKENPELIREVSSWLGTPYRYGGSTKAGADCSGFVWAVYRNVYQMTIPRTTSSMLAQSRRVSQRRLREGDLVFFRTRGFKVNHVGIYLGNGHFIHASTSRGVIVNELNEDFYSRRFRRGGRL